MRRIRPLWWVAGTLIVGSIIFAVVISSRFGDEPTFADSPLIGRPLPDVTLASLDGSGDVHIPDLAGDITVFNFWASWCLPCRNEHPLLEQAAERFPFVNFYGIVFQDTADRANEFLDEFGRSYPHLLDPDSRGAINFGVFGPPETYFVDSEGIIVAKIVGELRPGFLEDTLTRIILGERPGQRTLGTVQLQEDA